MGVCIYLSSDGTKKKKKWRSRGETRDESKRKGEDDEREETKVEKEEEIEEGIGAERLRGVGEVASGLIVQFLYFTFTRNLEIKLLQKLIIIKSVHRNR